MENFDSILSFIRNSRRQALAAVNTELIIRNWLLGKYISYKMAQAQWGDKTLQQLSAFIREQEPGIKGFEKRSLERMPKFYEVWATSPTGFLTFYTGVLQLRQNL